MMLDMRTLFGTVLVGSVLVVGCGDSGSGGAGAEGGAGGSGGSGGSGATGGAGGAGGGADYSADIATYCTNIDVCWDDAEPCVDSITAGIAATPGCDADLVAMFACVEQNGVFAEAECEGAAVPCQVEIMDAYSCLDLK